MLGHYALLNAPNLGARCVECVATFTDSVARKIAACTAGIAHCHGKVALFVALKTHGCPVFRAIRHVVLAIWGRSIVLVGIYSEHTEVASLARPHPVIGISAELPH